MKNYIIITLLLFLLCGAASGHDHAYLRISVSEGVEIEENISFTIWNHFVRLGSSFESETYDVLPLFDQPFEVRIPNPNEHMRIRLVSSKVGLLLPFVLVEPGDSILMHIHKIYGRDADISFSGPGSRKYQFYEEFKLAKTEMGQFWSEVRSTDDPKKLEQNIDRLEERWLLNLERYKSEISERLYQIIKSDIIGYFAHTKLWMITIGYAESTGENKSGFEKILIRMITKEDSPHFNDYLAYSTEYVEYLYKKEKIRLLHKYNPAFRERDMANHSPFSYSVLYEQLRDNYQSDLRDQLIAYSFLNSRDLRWFFYDMSPDEFQEKLVEASNILQNDALVRLIDREKSTLSPGQKALDFALPNVNDQLVRLSDFQGKVVLVDFWGDGCGACLSFKRRFEVEVYPHLKDYSDFVFVSINVDRRKERWLNALPKYSNPEFVNLGLYDLGTHHPVYQHYNIKALPFHLLVDRFGKIVSTRLPNDSKDLLDLIILYLD